MAWYNLMKQSDFYVFTFQFCIKLFYDSSKLFYTNPMPLYRTDLICYIDLFGILVSVIPVCVLTAFFSLFLRAHCPPSFHTELPTCIFLTISNRMERWNFPQVSLCTRKAVLIVIPVASNPSSSLVAHCVYLGLCNCKAKILNNCREDERIRASYR